MRTGVTRQQSDLIQQGIVLQGQRRFVDAERCYQTVLRLNPKHPDALNLMGTLAVEAGRMDVAIDYMRRAVKLLPNEPMYLNNLGNALFIVSRYEEAAAHLQKATKIDPRNAEAWSNLGKTRRYLGEVDRARQCFEKALAAQPGFLRAQAGLAETESELGRFDVAESMFNSILKAAPGNLEAMCGLAAIRKYEPDDPYVAKLEAFMKRADLRDDERAPLHHAFAKVCNDIGRYDDAMAHFQIGKKFRKLMFHMELHLATYAAHRQTFTRAFFAERANYGSQDERPVFVVGMPRSGTTLTEQVLSAHGQVEGLGELPDMKLISRSLEYGTATPADFGRKVTALSRNDIKAMANTYMKAYERAPQKALRLVDKSPHNYEMLGLIALMFPKARVIHCIREPMDNCVAIYMQNFSDAHGYNSDLTTLGKYYRAYADLMVHWRSVLPLPIHENAYENTVADLEGSARAMVEHIGLPWDPNCLNYHETERLVRTPSRWQVRQPIYSTSVERWRRYEKHLGPLKSALGIS